MNTPSDSRASRSRRPGLTVAIPTYNGARYLATTIDSILAQTDASFDLIVCDDQSTDSTREIVRQRAGERVRLWINPVRLRLAGNWNACIEQSETEWVAIVHQDDVLLPGHLSAHLSTASRYPDAGLIASSAVAIDPEGCRITDGSIEAGGLGLVDRLFPALTLLETLAVSNPLRCSAVTVRADVHQTLGGFDPAYGYVVDWDFWLRVASRYPVAWLASPTVGFRWHKASETHRFKIGVTDLEETEKLLTTLSANAPAGSSQSRGLAPAARDRLGRAYLNRAYEASRAGNRRLTWTALRKSLTHSPGIAWKLAADWRLLGRLFLGPISARKPGVVGKSDAKEIADR